MANSVRTQSAIVLPDRRSPPKYPNWENDVVHPKLELSGPAKFDLSKVEQWLHSGQRKGSVRGSQIYKYLKRNHMLDSCFNLADLLAIQSLGLRVFRRYFTGKMVFAFKSVIQNYRGDLYVPCLFELEGQDKVVLYWRDLVFKQNASKPTLRLASHRS